MLPETFANGDFMIIFYQLCLTQPDLKLFVSLSSLNKKWRSYFLEGYHDFIQRYEQLILSNISELCDRSIFEQDSVTFQLFERDNFHHNYAKIIIDIFSTGVFTYVKKAEKGKIKAKNFMLKRLLDNYSFHGKKYHTNTELYRQYYCVYQKLNFITRKLNTATVFAAREYRSR